MGERFGEGMAWTRLRWLRGRKEAAWPEGEPPAGVCGQVGGLGLWCWSPGPGGLREPQSVGVLGEGPV